MSASVWDFTFLQGVKVVDFTQFEAGPSCTVHDQPDEHGKFRGDRAVSQLTPFATEPSFCLDIAATLYLGSIAPDEAMGALLLRTLAGGRVFPNLRAPAAGPGPMRGERGQDRGARPAGGAS